MNIIVGLIIVWAGIIVIKYKNQIYWFTGEWGWAEKYLWANGTPNAIVLAGALLMFFGFWYALGTFDDFWKAENLLPWQIETNKKVYWN